MMTRTLSFILFFLVSLVCSHAAEREYVISNISRLLDSYSTVDFRKGTDEAIDPQKYDCALKVNEFNRQQSKTLKDLFDQFVQGKIDEDKLLRSVLDIRFRNLNFFQRHKGFKFDMKYNPFPNINLNPGSSILCKKLEVGGCFNLLGEDYAKYIVGAEGGGVLLRFISISEQDSYDKFGNVIKAYEKMRDREVKEAFTPLINDNLYVLTQIILGIFSLSQPHLFSYDTIDYISASKSLWPLLEKVAQGADPFLLDDDVSLFDNKALINEYEIYATCLLQTSIVKMPFMGLGCNPSRDYMKSLGTLMQSGALLGKWSLPELPAILSKMGVPQIPAMETSPSILAVDIKPAKNKKPHMHAHGLSVQKQNKRPISPNSYGKAGKQMSSSDTQPHKKEDAPRIEPVSKPAAVAPQISIETPLTLHVSSEGISTAASFSELEPMAVDSWFDDESIDDQVYDFASYNKISSKGKGKGNKKETSPSSSSPSVTTTPAPQEHVFASWNRKLHAQRNLADIPLRTEPVAPTQLKVLQDIFDASTKITYGVFESLWLHLNGDKSVKPSHKKSHRRLLNSNGRVVGGTFALHGSKHQYSDDNKRELQDALTLIGCGRSYLSSLENK